MTRTHTHTVERFANPFLRCDICGEPVEGFIPEEGQAIGCDHRGQLVPCGHVGIHSLCPSWSPVDGCQCGEHLGYVSHKPAREFGEKK